MQNISEKQQKVIAMAVLYSGPSQSQPTINRRDPSQWELQKFCMKRYIYIKFYKIPNRKIKLMNNFVYDYKNWYSNFSLNF